MTRSSFLIGFTVAALVVPMHAQTLGGCAVFPADSIWNTPIDTLPPHPNSAAYVNTVGTAKGLHPDFSSEGLYGLPFVFVAGTQPKVGVTFTYAGESNPGPYPITRCADRRWAR